MVVEKEDAEGKEDVKGVEGVGTLGDARVFEDDDWAKSVAALDASKISSIEFKHCC